MSIGVHGELHSEGMSETFLLALPASITGLAEVRSAIRDWLEPLVVDREALGDLIAVASEFVLHVLVKSGGSGQIEVSAEHGASGVRLGVRSNAAVASAPRAIELPPDPLGPDALGRRIVETCCDEIVVTNDESGTHLECWRRFRSA